MLVVIKPQTRQCVKNHVWEVKWPRGYKHPVYEFLRNTTFHICYLRRQLLAQDLKPVLLFHHNLIFPLIFPTSFFHLTVCFIYEVLYLAWKLNRWIICWVINRNLRPIIYSRFSVVLAFYLKPNSIHIVYTDVYCIINRKPFLLIARCYNALLFLQRVKRIRSSNVDLSFSISVPHHKIYSVFSFDGEFFNLRKALVIPRCNVEFFISIKLFDSRIIQETFINTIGIKVITKTICLLEIAINLPSFLLIERKKNDWTFWYNCVNHESR